jgi:hypothetical protein
MGVFAHLFQPALKGRQIRSGLKADRHLWRFLSKVLNPQDVAWENLVENEVYALSTDLSEATDWGHKGVARQIWQALIEASDQPDFPLGLAVLAKTKYCGKRFCFLPNGAGYSLVVANRGWLMGDMMTKVILTLSHQYCCELSGLTTYTLVGDDEIALESDRRKLENHLQTLGTIFKVSDLDTYVSSTFAFYCEEGTLLPQKASESLHVQMRRGQELSYLDYPRIRLLLPQIIETDAYSMTNIGRFALLGKESRWVHQVNPGAARVFAQATLLQHILVPQDRDTLCPFTPIEIGGDGAWPHSDSFLRRVIDDKTADPRETKWRMSSLLNNKFSYKFVRSDKLDKVVNKHHLYLPKIEGLRALLPEEAVIVPRDENNKYLIQSTKFDDLMDPQAVFFQLAKGCYYAALMAGRTPPEPVFSIDRKFTGGHTTDPQVDAQMFRSIWANPGFKFQDWWGYMVDNTKIPHLNPMNLGWDWTLQRTRYPNASEILRLWVQENLDFAESSFDDVLALLRDGKPLPKRVVDRLNLVIESDSYILATLPKEWEVIEYTGIVTRDQRLCYRVKRHLDVRYPGIDHKVICLDPAIYMIGRTEEATNLFRPLGITEWDVPLLTDPGAMLHVDYNEFTDGFPHREDIWDVEVTSFTNRYGIPVVLL